MIARGARTRPWTASPRFRTSGYNASVEPVKRVTAKCEREEGCPLYQKGDRISFSSVAVDGVERAPICYRAVLKFMPVIEKIRGGSPPWNFDRTYCGGCEQGKAWFSFSTTEPQAAPQLTNRFEEFALAALAKIKLFHGVHPTILRRIVPFLRERSVRAGDVLVRGGERIDALYMIVGGRFDVLTRDDKKTEKTLMTLARGDCVGEMSLVTGEPSQATIISCGAGQLLEVSGRDFATLLSLVPTLGLSLARDVLHRISRMSHVAAAETRDGILGRLEVVGPAELVQAMHLNRQTGVLAVQDEGTHGTMYFEDGEVLDARIGHEVGEEAFYAFLRWTRGGFRFEAGRRDVSRLLHRDTMGLLLEGLRRIDESARAATGAALTEPVSGS